MSTNVIVNKAEAASKAFCSNVDHISLVFVLFFFYCKLFCAVINLAVKKRKKNRIVDNDVTMVNETIAAVVNSCLIKKNKRKYNEKERERVTNNNKLLRAIIYQRKQQWHVRQGK